MLPLDTSSVADGLKVKRRPFAIVSTWPDTKNAEFEVIERLLGAARNIDTLAFVIDDDGYILSASDGSADLVGQQVSAEFCEFVISLHFQSPRLYDIPSYVTLWNPPDFYHDFGYAGSTAKLASHSGFLSCHSDIADAHAANLMHGLGREVPQPFPALFHSLPEPFLEPRIHVGSKLFYIGINWERISGARGRHQGLLEDLDRDDLISIYGPEEFYGVRPWEGFRNYRGSIPFDGRSVLAELNEAGVCLAFSSQSHQQSGIMSNRLFEGLAAGAAVIANPHRFIDKYFADCVYVVDDEDVDETAKRVRELLDGIRRDPSEAIARAKRGQERLRERFSLEHCLLALFEEHDARTALLSSPPASIAEDSVVTVVVAFDGEDGEELRALVANAARQRGVALDLAVVADPSLFERHCAAERHFIRDVRFVGPADHKAGRTLGSAVAEALSEVGTPYVCVMEQDEHWFSDHLASLVRKLDDAPDKPMACAGRILEDIIPPGRIRRRLDRLGFDEFAEIVAAVYPGDAGRFLFRAEALAAIPPTLLPLLDGCEARALRLWAFLSGGIVPSNYASFVGRLRFLDKPRASSVPEQQQIDYILDSVRGRPDWLRLHAELVADRPLRHAGTPRLELGRMHATKTGESGTPFLRAGFSAVESFFTWVDGPTACLEFELAPKVGDARVELVVGGRDTFVGREPQRLTVLANGTPIIENAIVPEGGRRLRASLPTGNRPKSGKMRVMLQLAHAEQPRDAEGKVVDPRYLGLHLSAFGVFPQSLPRLEIDQLYEFRENGAGVGMLEDGFSSPEAYFTWMDGREACIAFEVPPCAEPLEAMLMAGGPVHSSTGEPQRISVFLGGSPLIENAALKESAEGLTIPLPIVSDARPTKVRLELVAAHAEQPTAPDGMVLDPRCLGVHLVSLRLSPRRPER